MYTKEIIKKVFNGPSVQRYTQLPIRYFFLAGFSSSEKVNLPKKCLNFVTKSGDIVISLTFDGTVSNLEMARLLGCQLHPNANIKTFFRHDSFQRNIYIYLDACHMFKLIMHCLANKRELTDSEKNQIK